MTTRLRLLPDATAYRLYRRADPNSDALYVGQLAYRLDGELPALWFSDLPAEEADAVEALGAALDAHSLHKPTLKRCRARRSRSLISV